MGKNLIQQARGKGGPTYRAPSFRYLGKISCPNANKEGTVIDIVKCQGHDAPLIKVKYTDNTEGLLIAPEGIKVGEMIVIDTNAPKKNGNTLPLKNIAEGTLIYNLESMPGDGGKFVRVPGTFAKVLSQTKNGILVELPSKKQREFNSNCRASIGIVAGSGRKEKPLLKAGKMFYKRKARNRLYPRVSGTSMNAVDHPFGTSRSSRKGSPTTISRNAPPGAKVGLVAARRTGRKKGKNIQIK
jgi:large subunit ribosomal protein L2